MSKKLPKATDFPTNLTIDIIPPPRNDKPTNILILLHGLGDTNTPFTTFGRSISLPETICLSIRGHSPLPFDLGGFHWGDDIQFSQVNDSIDPDAGFVKASKILVEGVIRETLIGKCGYKMRDVVLFGFGQGGMTALSSVLKIGFDEELGGVVSVGGALPSDTTVPKKKIRTPVLLCHGNRKSAVSDDDVDRMKETFEFVEIREWPKTGDGMPSNGDEMMPVMQFFARRLRSVKGVPAGSVEIS